MVNNAYNNLDALELNKTPYIFGSESGIKKPIQLWIKRCADIRVRGNLKKLRRRKNQVIEVIHFDPSIPEKTGVLTRGRT